MDIRRRRNAYVLARRGFCLAALAGLAELLYLKERETKKTDISETESKAREKGHEVAAFRPVFVRPSQVLDLRRWKLNLPTRDQQVSQPRLAHFHDRAFRVVEAVQFTAWCGGQPQPGSKYPRSELREMNPDGSTAAWSSTSGTHVMELTQRVTHLPVAKPQLVCGQIHNEADYLILVELDGRRLYVRYRDAVAGVLDDNYHLGTYFDVKIRASHGYADVFYNGVRKVHQRLHARGCYFKAGCYVQSNTSTGDLPAAFGQVEITRLVVSHT
jgi:Alginate lyase